MIKNNKIGKLKVVVGMSGGVDSSVAAALLKDQGYDVIGVFMQFWFPEGAVYGENRCCSLESFNEARQVADILGIPLHKLNFGQAFKDSIVDGFLSEYKAGKTPNPCVTCNKFIKFGLFLDRAKVVFGADYVATGHYAKLVSSQRRLGSRMRINLDSRLRGNDNMMGSGMTTRLLRGKDSQKDQSYFLYNLKQKQLKHILFPLSDFEKSEVRKLAQKYGLPVHSKKDSQEVCFVGESHQEFLKKYLKLKPGKIITYDFISTPPQPSSSDKRRENSRGAKRGLLLPLAKGEVGRESELGQHEGLPLYTIGQRTGIGLSGGPWYVCGFDYRKNILIVTKNEKKSAIYSRELSFYKANWITGEPKFPLKCEAQVRYRSKPSPCVVTKSAKGFLVKFKEDQRAVMPGQSVVFYCGDELIGGGIIR